MLFVMLTMDCMGLWGHHYCYQFYILDLLLFDSYQGFIKNFVSIKIFDGQDDVGFVEWAIVEDRMYFIFLWMNK